MPPALLKKKLKEKTEQKKKKMKVKEAEGEEAPPEVAPVPTPVPPSGELPQDESAMDGMEPMEETAPIKADPG